jgi:hypothetical protein
MTKPLTTLDYSRRFEQADICLPLAARRRPSLAPHRGTPLAYWTLVQLSSAAWCS